MLRTTLGLVAFTLLAYVVVEKADFYLNSPAVCRQHDFLQVWSAGKLTLAGDNPYDAKKMLHLQLVNKSPYGYASMMWVPPWGLAVAIPIGALPVPYAHAVWIFGQLGLILLAGHILWRLNGGHANHAWVVAILVFTSGPVWWQTAVGQYAGVLLFGLVGYLWAAKANRPILAGLFLALTALKPHLFVLFGVGLLIDAIRTNFGRRVLLGGVIGLTAAALVATLASSAVWRQYFVALGSNASPEAPSLRDWFSPTLAAWIRFSIPGHAFWIQLVPGTIAALGFGIYWWRCGSPHRWPETLYWVIPVGLQLSPYGSWPSDLTLMLIPIIGTVARLDARHAEVPARLPFAILYLGTNLTVMAMHVMYAGTALYVLIVPLLSLCVFWARLGLNPKESRATADVDPGSHRLQAQALAQ
jgi:hypothetical protein